MSELRGWKARNESRNKTLTKSAGEIEDQEKKKALIEEIVDYSADFELPAFVEIIKQRDDIETTELLNTNYPQYQWWKKQNRGGRW